MEDAELHHPKEELVGDADNESVSQVNNKTVDNYADDSIIDIHETAQLYHSFIYIENCVSVLRLVITKENLL